MYDGDDNFLFKFSWWLVISMNQQFLTCIHKQKASDGSSVTRLV